LSDYPAKYFVLNGEPERTRISDLLRVKHSGGAILFILLNSQICVILGPMTQTKTVPQPGAEGTR
jgi:hypothetical protein